MKVKFNKFERVAGLFVLSALVGGILILIGVAIKQGWFETRVPFTANFTNADGIRPGTMVQIAGLRAGAVTDVQLRAGNSIFVSFEVSERYKDLIRKNSVVRTIRPFVISEKVLDITIGDASEPLAMAGQELKAEASNDIMDLVSGRTLAPYLGTVSKMLDNLRFIAEAILNPERSKDIVKIFDDLAPLVANMSHMSKDVSSLIQETNHDHKLGHVVNNLAMTTDEVNRLLPELNKIVPQIAKLAPIIGEKSPQLAADLTKIASNMAILTDEMQKTLPVFKETLQAVGPEIPRASRRAMEALDETVVTLKALQKSFLLSSNAREVRAEEAKAEIERKQEAQATSEKARRPAAVLPSLSPVHSSEPLFCPNEEPLHPSESK